MNSTGITISWTCPQDSGGSDTYYTISMVELESLGDDGKDDSNVIQLISCYDITHNTQTESIYRLLHNCHFTQWGQ